MKLANRHLTALSDVLKVPRYDRNSLKTGIVHIGVGGFHRAHQGLVLQKLIELGDAQDWGVCGVGLRKEDKKISQIIDRHDCLYTLITRFPDGKVDTEVMGQLVSFLWAPENKKAVIDRMASPETKIVSMTITEGGYNLRSDGSLDLDHNDIQHDMNNTEDPITIYGYLKAALKIRMERSETPFTIMSCDNIQHNGDVIRKMMLSFLSDEDREFTDWVKQNVTFPNSMVDRITPVTTAAELDFLKGNFDLEDEWPVTCEPFLQWVIEDNFSEGRPDFDRIEGVQFVKDVMPYEKMKIRLLNAGHSLLGIFGALMGIETINECLSNEQLRNILRLFWEKEALPILSEVDGIDLKAYMDTLEERFANPNIQDKVSRICSETSAKLPRFLLPTIQENLEHEGCIGIATLVVASWCYYCDKQSDWNGKPLEIIDVLALDLHRAAKGTEDDVLSFLRVREVFGDLIENRVFTNLYSKTILELYRQPELHVQFSIHLR